MEKVLLIEPRPGDVILMASEATGLYGWLERWLLSSRWSHIAIFYDYTKRGLPLVIESIGRGVMIRSLLASEGRYILVLRHESVITAQVAAGRAERLAGTPGSWYDYWAIPRFVLPRLVWYKLTRRRSGFGYRHNPHFLCSELVDEAFNRIIPPELEPPLPHDFLAVKEFRPAGEGKLAFTETLKRRRD